ncbi:MULTISPECIES: sulfotransferase family 2 domain-containing protein [unclassified Pseudomonas]|uniref:sulfotransferase family 2 domain-containing protein n=1 Tax=unclassified Pseudomonas TaxID=196821 RepID=UPI000EFABEF9|nr:MULTISPECIES: sulfotransferase family 2 domain-containing protein [unclassified Pseudomonas]AYN92949.1 hypothetical protein EAW52_02650 [Pseudomonas sp. LTJR-52]
MKKPFYYLHIPKTGGTSLISFLDNQFDVDETCPAQLLPELFATPRDRLSQYAFYRGHLWYGLGTYLNRELRYMTMLRDPVQRTISWYSHVRREAGAYRHRQMVEENWSLLDFVQNEETHWDMVNTQTLFLAADLDFERLSQDPVGYGQAAIQQYAQRRNDRSLLELAKQRLTQFDFVGITERMQDSMLLLSYVLNTYPNRYEERLNVSSNRPTEKEISSDVIDAIKALTPLDQELYEWAYQQFDQRFKQMVESLLTERYLHNPDSHIVSWQKSLSSADRALFKLKASQYPAQTIPSEAFIVSLDIFNASRFIVASRPPAPVNLSYHWLDAEGSAVVFDGLRTPLPQPLEPQQTITVPVSVQAPERKGTYTLRITLVQEGVAWFDDSKAFTDIGFIVE